MRRKVGPGVHVGPHFGGRGGRSESAMVPFERAKVVSCNCDHCAICNHSAAICDRMSPTLKSTGTLLGQNLGRM